MKKVKEIVYLERGERSPYSTGIRFIFEDGSSIEQMTTDVIAWEEKKP